MSLFPMQTNHISSIEGHERMPGKDSMEIVPGLLALQFKLNSIEARIQILKHGRPRFSLVDIKKEKTRGTSTVFNESWYDDLPWLCGSATLNKLFCWPCLLMRPDTSSWCTTGIDDFGKLTTLAAKHSSSKSHYKAISEYDGTLVEAGMLPQFTNESNRQETDKGGTDSDSDHLGHYLAPKLPNSSLPTASNVNSFYPGSERRTLTFQAWQQANQALLNGTDPKLARRRRRLARLDIRNAQLTAQKLRLEIQLLEGKLQLQQALQKDSVPRPHEPSQSTSAT